MISGVESTYTAPFSRIGGHMEQVRERVASKTEQVGGIEAPRQSQGAGSLAESESSHKVTFSSLIGNLVEGVDGKSKEGVQELKKVMTGEVDNLHQSMIAMQEANIAFTLMVEVRNKLMESYQQVMRMQV
jgi:flagellar hook-basal body complex protein FliE